MGRELARLHADRLHGGKWLAIKLRHLHEVHELQCAGRSNASSQVASVTSDRRRVNRVPTRRFVGSILVSQPKRA
jgi:hypothetical protein